MHDSLADRDQLQVVPVTVGAKSRRGVSVAKGMLHENGAAVCDLSQAAALPGRHNWQNAAAAFAAARACGLSSEKLADAILDFPGLPHRMERIGSVHGIPVINDSKATNAEAAARAIACFENVYWIAGGRPKEGGIDAIAPHFPRIAHAFLIGEAEDAFAATLRGQLPVTRCGTLDRAVAAALDAACENGRAGTVVLFSPACASFDQFSDFEQRGERFRALVPVDRAGPREEEAPPCTRWTPFSRADTSLLGRWWWTVDRWMLTAVLLLMLIGAALALAASPAAAERIGLDSFHFARQQLFFLPVALIVMLGVSLMSRTGVQRIGVAGTALTIALLALTLIVGLELNGARGGCRWAAFTCSRRSS